MSEDESDARERWMQRILADAPPLTPQQLGLIRAVLRDG